MKNNLSLLGQPELVKRVTDPVTLLTGSDLDDTLLSTLRTELEQVQHIAGLTLDLGGPTPVHVRVLPQHERFRQDLLRVYDSWLAQRISGGERASIAAHVGLLRAAAVVLEWVDRPQQVQETSLTTWLNEAVIMTPRSWTRCEQSRLDGPTRRASRPNAPERGRNAEAHDLRAQLAGVTTGLEAMRKVTNAIVESRALWERSQQSIITDATPDDRDRDDREVEIAARARSPLSEDEIRAAFAQSLATIQGIPAGTRTKLGKIIDHEGPMNEFFGDLGVVVDTEDPDLCAEIQAIETALLHDLPPAPNPTKPDRPPLISTIGLGDLVVARERLVGYEAYEIAHIENVLPGEAKRVENERLYRFETTTEAETTTESESQTDNSTTDRDSSQSQAQSELSKSLSVDAGVNVSSKYGATKIDASLDVQFQRSLSESASETTDSVNEVITRTVEREREEVRNLRRTVSLDETRSLSRHTIDNTTEGVGPSPEPISGVYRWVEKVQEIELRRYGTRLMVEFHIPEPAVSILEAQQTTATQPVRGLPRFDVRPRDLSRQTFMCLAQRYGATLAPPPAEWIEVPFHQASQVDKSINYDGKYVHTGLINVPSEYRPVSVSVTVTATPKAINTDGWERPYITVAVGTARRQYVIKNNGVVVEQFAGPAIASLWPTVTALGFVSSTAYFNPSVPVEQGLPVSVSALRADDNAFTVQAVVSAKLTDEAWQAWQLDSWDQLRQAHAQKQDELDRREREKQINESFGIATTERPSSINRRTERTELKKWAIKAIRHETFDFHPMVTEDGLQEIDASDTYAQAPVTAFFEQCFEWAHMTYVLYPYYWARRDTWQLRQQQRSVDPTHEAFLQSGAARVIVPVTPGFERRLLCYLNFDDTDLSVHVPGMDIPCPDDPMTDDAHAATPDFYDVGLDILTERHGDLVRGSGTLNVIQGEAQVTINPDSLWAANHKDIGRELQIDGRDYEVSDVPSPTTLLLDRPIETDDREAIHYAAGSLRYSAPWQVRVPTNLVVLVEEALE